VVVRVPADYTTGLCVRASPPFAAITLERADGDIAELVRSRACRRPAPCSVCTAERKVYRLGVTAEAFTMAGSLEPQLERRAVRFRNTYWTLVNPTAGASQLLRGDYRPRGIGSKSHLIHE